MEIKNYIIAAAISLTCLSCSTEKDEPTRGTTTGGGTTQTEVVFPAIPDDVTMALRSESLTYDYGEPGIMFTRTAVGVYAATNIVDGTGVVVNIPALTLSIDGAAPIALTALTAESATLYHLTTTDNRLFSLKLDNWLK